MRLIWAIILAIGLALPGALAVNPDEVLANPALEARARALSSELRCLVCQNQSIDDSDAELARELRVVVREQLSSGASDQDVRDFLVDRYGEFVLLRPVFGGHTLILWIAAPFLLLVGIAYLVLSIRRRRPPVDTDLTEAERKALAALERGEAE